jgi:hypothetical protein
VTDKDPEDLDDDDFNENSIRANMPLKEGVLKINLGIPILICCNKVDYL